LGRYSAEKLTATTERDRYTEMSTKRFTTIRLLGAGSVASVKVNGVEHAEFKVLPSGGVRIQILELPAKEPFTVEYSAV